MDTSAATAAPQRVDLLVEDVWLITADAQQRVLQGASVAIADGTIVDVGVFGRDRYRATSTIDGRGRVAMPGMVNGHRHLLTTPRGALPEGNPTLVNLKNFVYPAFAALTEDDMALYARHHAAEMIRFGTTLFQEPGCTHLEAVLETLAETGIKCRIGPWTWDQGGPAGENCPDWLRMSTAAAITRLEEGVDRVRAFGHDRLRDAVTIEGVGTCSDELTAAAAHLAADRDSLMVLHKATSEQEVALEERTFGERPVAHMNAIGALNEHVLLNHMTCIDDAEVGMVAESGARICQNPSAALKLAKGTTRSGRWRELIAAGVPLGLGTDGVNASNFQDICRAMYLAALLPRDANADPAAVSAADAVEMATIGGARALRWDDQVGSIEVGKRADLVIFDTDDFDWRPLHDPVANLVYGATGHSVDTVLIDGIVRLEGKTHVDVDIAELRDQIEALERRVLRDIQN